MPAGPAPTTATRSGWFPDGGAEASSVTPRILTPRGPRAPAQRARKRPSAAGVVAVQPGDDVLAEGHPPARGQRRWIAGRRRRGQRGAAGQPGMPPGEDAARADGADDLRPL